MRSPGLLLFAAACLLLAMDIVVAARNSAKVHLEMRHQTVGEESWEVRHAAEIDCGSIGNPTEEEKKVSFMLLGQQKSGTSTLWNLMTQHSRITTAGHRKEHFYFGASGSGHNARWDACDWPVEGYKGFMEADHAFDRMCAGQLLGDFTATHFSCPCCPKHFHEMDPDLKLMVVLREPLSRSQSRFKEQRELHGHWKDKPFEQLAEQEVEWIAESKNCPANKYLNRVPALQDTQHLYCSAMSNVIGWSNYPLYLKNWLNHFRADQLLVIYTEQIDRNPLVVLRAVEEFLGLEPFQYPQAILSNSHFNSGSCGYGWDSDCKQALVPAHQARPTYPPSVERYFDDVVRGVLGLAKQGKVTVPPLSWLDNGRLRRLGISEEEYLDIQSQGSARWEWSPTHINKRPAYRKMIEDLHLA